MRWDGGHKLFVCVGHGFATRGNDSPQTRNGTDSNEAWEQWFDFTCMVGILRIVLETTTDELKEPTSVIDNDDDDEKAILNLQGRLMGTLGDALGCEAMYLMHVLHKIGADVINMEESRQFTIYQKWRRNSRAEVVLWSWRSNNNFYIFFGRFSSRNTTRWHAMD